MARKPEDVDNAIRAIRQILSMFVVERILCVVGGVCSFGLFLFSAFKLIDSDTIDTGTMGIIFGASGISTAASAGITYYFNKSFSIVERLILGAAMQAESPPAAAAPAESAAA